MQTPRLPLLPLRLPEQQVRYQHADNVQPDAVFRPAVRPLQRKVLFHPFEQQLDLPALFVVVRNFRRTAFVVVRHQNQRPAFFARNFNAPQCFVVIVVLLLLAADFFVFAADFPVAEDVFAAHGIFANLFKGRVFLQPRDEIRAGGVLKCILINGGQTKSNGDTVYLSCANSNYRLLSPLPWAEYKAKRQIRQ